MRKGLGLVVVGSVTCFREEHVKVLTVNFKKMTEQGHCISLSSTGSFENSFLEPVPVIALAANPQMLKLGPLSLP